MSTNDAGQEVEPQSAPDRSLWEVAQWEAAAKEQLTAEAYDYFAGGAGDELTLDENERAWRAIRLRPRIARDVSAVVSATTILGSPLAAPVAVAPCAYQSLAHPEAEVAMAKGVASSGSLLTVSSRASRSFDEVSSAVGGAPWWCQVYVLRDRARTEAMVRESVAAGARALVLTADTPVLGKRLRDVRNGFVAPETMTSVSWAKRSEVTSAGHEQSPAVTFADICWLRDLSGVPVVVKGVIRADDAVAAVAAGADAIWVSNHGGRQLDGCVATALVLGEVVDAVGDTEVYVDGGVRTGVDVVRALALGARAAFVARPALWGLSVAGASGVESVISTLSGEFRRAMQLCGAATLDEIDSDLLD